MKVGIIGCGTIANAQHIPAYLNNSKAEIKYFVFDGVKPNPTVTNVHDGLRMDTWNSLSHPHA